MKTPGAAAYSGTEELKNGGRRGELTRSSPPTERNETQQSKTTIRQHNCTSRNYRPHKIPGMHTLYNKERKEGKTEEDREAQPHKRRNREKYPEQTPQKRSPHATTTRKEEEEKRPEQKKRP